MKKNYLTKNSPDELFLNLSNLHKKSLKKTIATSLSQKKLAKVYKYLVSENLYSVLIIQDGTKIVGSLSFRSKESKLSIKNLITISLLTLSGFLKNPIIWIMEAYYKLGLYKNIIDSIKIITVFVDAEYQNQKIGNQLLSHIKGKHFENISLDTRVENFKAINFYEDNGFVIVNKNRRNVVLKYK